MPWHWYWALLLLLGAAPALLAQPLVEEESRIKAAFLYNFAKFMEWPDKVHPTQSSDIQLCVIGQDPFKSNLISIHGKTVRGRTLTTRLIQRPKDIDHCHLLFISHSERNQLNTLLARGHDAHVLTISDMENFTAVGGIIQLTTINQKVRFEINTEAARLAGIKISSRLLRLASRIYGNEQEEEQ